MTSRAHGPVDTLLDVAVYAPIGAFFHGPEVVSELARRGRSQVANARLVGRVAARRGRAEAAKVTEQARHQVTDLLTAVARAAGAPLAGSADADTGADPTSPVTVDEPVDPTAPHDPVDERSEAHTLRVVPPTVPTVDELPIPDYDNLSAFQVVPRLESLARDELAAVREYERAHRGRMTILSRIAQLEAG